MAKIFAKQIKQGKITLDDVPAKWRNEVLAILEA